MSLQQGRANFYQSGKVYYTTNLSPQKNEIISNKSLKASPTLSTPESPVNIDDYEYFEEKDPSTYLLGINNFHNIFLCFKLHFISVRIKLFTNINKKHLLIYSFLRPILFQLLPKILISNNVYWYLGNFIAIICMGIVGNLLPSLFVKTKKDPPLLQSPQQYSPYQQTPPNIEKQKVSLIYNSPVESQKSTYNSTTIQLNVSPKSPKSPPVRTTQPLGSQTPTRTTPNFPNRISKLTS